MRLFWYSLIYSLLVGCASPDNTTIHEQENEYIGIQNGQLVFNSGITKQSKVELFNAFQSASVIPNRLLVSSKGGDIEQALEIGRWIHHHKLDVEVTKFCFSSCANYIFPAGVNKFLRKDSILLWHGSAWQQSWRIPDTAINMSEQDIRKLFTNLRTEESLFFDEIGVDNLLTVYGQHIDSLIDHFWRMIGRGSIGFDYSLNDLERLGLTNIRLIDGDWNWRDSNTDKSHLIKRVKLDDNFQFERLRFDKNDAESIPLILKN